MLIWLKINNDFGLTGVSQGSTIKDVDNHISTDEVDRLLGANARKFIREAIENHCEETGAYELPDEVIDFLANLGWTYDNEAYCQNADIQAPAFRNDFLGIGI